MKERMHRDLRLLRLWAISSNCALLVVFLGASGWAQPERARFTEIDVERINVVESDGRVRLVVANGARQADAVIDGRVVAPGGRRPAGMIFFNEEGDEVGGLLFSGRRQDGSPRASGSLTFDQFKQDQTVALQYAEGNGQRRAGLAVIDRPEASIARFAELFDRRDAAGSADDRAAVEREIAALGEMSNPRMFVGKDLDGNSTLTLSDGRGRERLILVVDRQGGARIQFLDENGNVVREITP